MAMNANLPDLLLRWNWQELCGCPEFHIWTKNHVDLSSCFQLLCLHIPILTLVAIISSYYCGSEYRWIYRTWRERTILNIRLLVTIALILLSISKVVIQFYVSAANSIPVVDVLHAAVQTIAGFFHSYYILALNRRLGPTLRGPIVLGCIWTLYYVVCTVSFRSALLKFDDSDEYRMNLVFWFLVFVSQTIYGLTMIPSEESHSRRNSAACEEDIMHSSLINLCNRNRDNIEASYLGQAGENCGVLSKLLFLWANPLMEKGMADGLETHHDVFDLPEHLWTHNLHQRFNNAKRSRDTLFKVLQACFAFEFYSVGLLKVLADAFGFASPILLSRFLSFMENDSAPIQHGYAYAFGIFIASFLSCFFSVHFNYAIGKVNLKLRGSMVVAIFKKTLNLTPASFSKISVGEIINYISTDMDRIVNSCESFHSVWSIPLQIAVTLYLLYSQVGIAFLAGLIFSIILIPINKCVAVKIGELSVKMMSSKDERVEITSEMIRGMRSIRFHVWEEYFTCRILGVRQKEMKFLKYRKYLDAICVYFWATTPVIVSILTISAYIHIGGKLTASVVFTTIALLNMLISPLNAFPWVLNGVIEAWVSLERIDKFMKAEEVDYASFYSTINVDGNAFEISNGTFSWTGEEATISDINFQAKKGLLIGICGRVGSGKTAFLHSVIGEIRKLRGCVRMSEVENGIAYVCQVPWIQRCSVRDNILFGKPYDAHKYKCVLEACALIDDTNIWPRGDLEIIGESGSTLSGGQKARIALARADKNLYILDDVFSSLDNNVAVHIFRNCVNGLLKDKTRVLATHNNKILRQVDVVLHIRDGKIDYAGNIEGYFTSTIVNVERGRYVEPPAGETSPDDPVALSEDDWELRSKGTVSLKIYAAYVKIIGYIVAIAVLVTVALMQVSRNATDWWLSIWVEQNSTNYSHHYCEIFPNRSISFYENDAFSYFGEFLTVFMGIGAFNSAITIVRSFLFAYGGIKAAIKIHGILLQNISMAKIAFFDVNPVGRILNRFSSDMYTVDDSLPFVLNNLLAQFASVIGTLALATYGMPWLCLFLAPLLPLYYWIQNRYRVTSRELKRLASVTLSPLYSHFSETIAGLTTIRAFRESLRFSGMIAALWLSIRLQMIGVAIVGAICLLSILQHHLDVSHSGFVGLSISYALSLTSKLGGVLQTFTETEREMIAMERLCEYIENPNLERRDQASNLPYYWSSHGVVSFLNVQFKHRENCALSLKNVSFETHPGEKVGIVGRTGAGKSSIFAALFRMGEISGGVITVDGANISDMNLTTLRSSLSIIPQESFLFAGTIRANLDPLEQSDDQDIYQSAERCGLASIIQRLGGLDRIVTRGGGDLSMGERQLICLLRAVLRNSKIVCIDEATANTDDETDAVIQKSIRKFLIGRTVFIIAHRMETVMDCDRLLVVGDGKVLEFDTPANLLQKDESHFRNLLKEYH